MERNPQIELAERYVTETGVSLFLTGKAGTGKTTFLHHIVEHCHKRNVVLAPTGVAAVNAGGMTIHSFFQLPPCLYLPDIPDLVTEYQMPERHRQLRKSKIDIIRTLDLLIIDEISMVRADLLDAVDATLRRYRRSSRPFGGVQLLMIGDVQQLPPVVTDDEKPYMERVYPSPFFFHSKALQRLPHITIQLTTVYRQQDPTFVNLLNNIRDCRFDPETLNLLNSRVKKQASTPSHPCGDSSEPIILTTHNYQADQINQQRLGALPTQPTCLQATVEGNFPDSSTPTDRNLILKPGAQVMFVKNDSSGSHRFFNGKIATVEEILEIPDENNGKHQVVTVIDDEGTTISVTPERWENIKYEINPSDNQIRQVVDGSFVQYPLKTAWAITIHKAQGLTFDRVQVNVSEAFTYGQVYVALSRCRSLDGITLLSPITTHNAFDNPVIEQFNDTLTSEAEAKANLEGFRMQYYFEMIFELFDFSAIQYEIERLERLFQEHLRSIYPQQTARMRDLANHEVANLANIAERFHHQLRTIGQLPQQEARPLLDERMRKASAYFSEQLDIIDQRIHPLSKVDLDNREVATKMNDTVERYRASAQLKQKLLQQTIESGFDMEQYQKAKVDFTLDKPRKTKALKLEEEYIDVKHPNLAKQLKKWRSNYAKEEGLPAYIILTQKSLLAIANLLPRNNKELLKIPGIGHAKMSKYGSEIIQVIDDYCYDMEHPKEPAYVQTARLLAEGMSVNDVAGAMLRTVSTVENHLVTAVENGILNADLILDPDQQDELLGYITEHPEISTLKPIFEHFNGKYSYMQIRTARILSRDL